MPLSQHALIATMANAIAEFEGFNMTEERWRRMGRALPKGWKPGDPITVAQRNNNPGNIRSWTGVPVVNGYAKFPTVQAGWEALWSQCRYNIFGRIGHDPYPLRRTSPVTFFEFFAGHRTENGKLKEGGYPGFAPAADSNHPTHYAEFVVTYFRERHALLGLPGNGESLTIQTIIRSLTEV